jgi:hypothetical protein
MLNVKLTVTAVTDFFNLMNAMPLLSLNTTCGQGCYNKED